LNTNRASQADGSLEVTLGNLLRWGTIVSAAVVLAGGCLFLATHGHEAPHYATFTGETSPLRSVREIVAEAAELRGRAIIQLGLLLLVATPIARVVGALVGFALRRDRSYVVISALVLSALLYGLLAG
jgi:uncharacterized membrane protein